MKKILFILDRLEDNFRSILSRYPVVYATLAGIGVVSFWRGVWETSDLMGIPPQVSLLFGFFILLSIGVLVTEFIGNRIIISGLKGEKKLEEKTLEEIENEENSLIELKNKIDNIERILKQHKKK